MEQFPVGVVLRPDHSQNAPQKTQIRNQIIRNLLRIEHQPKITDPVGIIFFLQKNRLSDPALLCAEMEIRASADIRTLQNRKRIHRLRRIRSLLIRLQFFGLLYDFTDLSRRERSLLFRKLSCCSGILLRCQPPLRNKRHHRGMRILKKPFPDQLFKIIGLRLLLERLEHLQLLQIIKGLFPVIEPAVKHIQHIEQPFREGGVIRLTEPEFVIVNAGIQGFFRNSADCQFLQRIPDNAQEPVLVLFVGVLRNNAEEWLKGSVIIGALHIFTDPGIQKSLFDRRAGGVQQDIFQNGKGHIKQGIRIVPYHKALGKIGIVPGRLVLQNRIFHGDIAASGKRFLEGNLRIHGDSVKGAQIGLIQPAQLLLHIQVSVETDIAVRGMIIFSVKIQKLFIGQLRNFLRVTAGFHSIGSVRKQMIENRAVQNLLRRREGALHFVVNHAVIGQRVGLLLHLVMPALLPEDFFVSVDVRIENRIQIDIHQILKIRVIAAGNRVNRLVRICHGIQECIQRSLCQFHKRVLQRKFSGTAEHRVLNNMGYTGRIFRRRPKTDGEYLVFIVIGQQGNSGPAFFMNQKRGIRVDVLNSLLTD